MKILLLAPFPFFQLRGTPIAVRLLTQVLTEAGHQVHILTYPEGEPVHLPNLSLSRLPAIPGIKNIKPGPSWKKLLYDTVMIGSLLRTVRRHRFDLIHAVEESVFMALAIKRVFKIPYIYDLDSSLSRQLADKYFLFKFLQTGLEFLEKAVIRGSLGAVTMCKALEDRVLDCDPQKMVLRLEDISLLPEEPDPHQGSTKIQEDVPVVMYVGNLEKYQGIDLLLDSFRLTKPKIPEARLMIIGGRDEDIAFYQNRARDLGIAEQTAFLGPKPTGELRFYFHQARILVSPRIQGENTPMKIYSYLDSGKPVLATDLPTHTQVLDGQIALLVSPVPEAVAEGMITLLQNSGLRDQLAQRAKERVQQEYCFTAFQKKLIKFYSDIELKLHHLQEGNL